MFTMYDKAKNRVPIRIWLPEASHVEEGCMEQATNLSNLPFVHRHVALMPDTHKGMGMPIGGVIATKGVIIPNAVGVDIGCGMVFSGTSIPARLLRETETASGSLLQCIIGDILRNVPVGFNHHKKPQPCQTLDRAKAQEGLYGRQPSLLAELETGYHQVGTLGGGNHFIELQEGDDGLLGIMIHSGSRHFGKEICDLFHKAAREENLRWHSEVPDAWRLAFLPVDTQLGKDYISWMNLALDFAHENRASMMNAVRGILDRWMEKVLGMEVEYGAEINCHHNYAALEHHFGENVWVHRKGAVRAREGEMAVVPGAMGSYSYVVEGLGNAESFCTSSHGAGRQYSRKGAMDAFSCEEVINDLKEQGVVLGKHNKKDVAEESRFAYKDIDMVMQNQKDLVTPVKRLRTVGVVKG